MNCSTPGLPVHHQLPVHWDSRPSSQWCHPAISSSVVPFSWRDYKASKEMKQIDRLYHFPASVIVSHVVYKKHTWHTTWSLWVVYMLAAFSKPPPPRYTEKWRSPLGNHVIFFLIWLDIKMHVLLVPTCDKLCLLYTGSHGLFSTPFMLNTLVEIVMKMCLKCWLKFSKTLIEWSVELDEFYWPWLYCYSP